MALKARVTLVLLLAVALCWMACTFQPRRLERGLERVQDRSADEGEYPTLRERIFSPRARFTGILRAERFNRILGFWIFLSGPHRPELMPVVLLHGHSTGPRRMRRIAESLDPERFEAWYSYYATGIELDRSAALLRRSLSEMASRYNQKRVALVAYSHGGLVARQALRPAADGVEMPEVPLMVSISVPWGGAEQRVLERDRTFSPGSWGDLLVGSRFLQHLFDDPLPPETEHHLVYGLGGRDRSRIPGEDDRLLSEESLSRSEAVSEAKSVTILRDATHLGIAEDDLTIALINHLLGHIDEPVSPLEVLPRQDTKVACGGLTPAVTR